MATYIINLLEKHRPFISSINGLINGFKGDFVRSETETGFSYHIEFEDAHVLDSFVIEYKKIIPDSF